MSNSAPDLLICSSLLLLATTACSGGVNATSAAPAQQRRVVTTRQQSPAASPVIVSAPQARRDGPPAGGASSALRTPSDGQQIVMVDSTDGDGVWVRRQPAGDPLKVWPDGSPMLVVGDDKLADGRTWRHVVTLDGQTGWVAADFVVTADPAMLAAGAPNLNELLAAARTAPLVKPDLQARVAVSDGNCPCGRLCRPIHGADPGRVSHPDRAEAVGGLHRPERGGANADRGIWSGPVPQSPVPPRSRPQPRSHGDPDQGTGRRDLT